ADAPHPHRLRRGPLLERLRLARIADRGTHPAGAARTERRGSVADLRHQRRHCGVRLLDASREHRSPAEGRGASLREAPWLRAATDRNARDWTRHRCRRARRGQVRAVKCAVVGAGAWGTALADRLAENGHETTIWAFEGDVASSINECGENRRFL